MNNLENQLNGVKGARDQVLIALASNCGHEFTANDLDKILPRLSISQIIPALTSACLSKKATRRYISNDEGKQVLVYKIFEQHESASEEDVSIMLVTPEMAQEWLGLNVSNRTVRNAHVDYISRSIESDNFMVTTNGVGFDTTGKLVDGQHRLIAIASSGKAVRMAVFKNLNSKAFVHIDTGISKNVSDRLNISNTLGKAANKIFILNDTHAKKKGTPDEIIHIVEKIKPYHDTLIERSSRYFGKAGIRVACMVQMALNPSDSDEIARVFNNLVCGKVTTPISAAWIAQSIQGVTSGDDDNDVLCKAMFVFNPKNFSCKSIRFTVEKRAALMNELRGAIRMMISGGGDLDSSFR
jgi:hypothetical protein